MTHPVQGPMGPNEPLEDAIRNARSILAQTDNGDAFSIAAFATFEGSISDYIRSLALESERHALRQQSDVISSVDVQQAARYLAAGAGKSKLRYFGTVGGILLGAAVSNALAIATSGHPHLGGLVATAAMLVVGTFLIAFEFARDS